MATEAMDRGGSPILTKGFYGGSFIESRVGLPPTELYNVGSSKDRQIVFYNGVAQLAGSGAYKNYWRDGGAMSSLKSEFSVAYENARARAGVIIPESIKTNYEDRIEAYVSCMGLADGIQHCDGSMSTLAEQIIPQEHEISLGWDEHKAELMLNDPAIVFPLSWIRDYADRGVLPYYWKKEKEEKDPTSIPIFITKTAELLHKDQDWKKYREAHDIPDDIEKSLVKIALSFYIVEDLPYLQKGLKDGTKKFTDPRAKDFKNKDGSIGLANPEDSKCGFLPFDNVYYSTILDPTGVLDFKQVFTKRPEIITEIKNFFKFADDNYSGAMGRKRPNEMTVKDLKRQGKVWELLVGGSQGSGLSDFSKFGEAIYGLCNLYNIQPKDGSRSDILGYMVGEAVYFKTMALMAGVPDSESTKQLRRVLSLGAFDTPEELERVSAGVLGAQGVGFYGALQTVAQFDLHIGTEHYNQAIAMLKSGIKDPKKALLGQKAMVAAAAFNRLTGSGGKKR